MLTLTFYEKGSLWFGGASVFLYLGWGYFCHHIPEYRYMAFAFVFWASANTVMLWPVIRKVLL